MLGIVDPDAAAYGSFDPATNHVSYFAVLKIETNPAYLDNEQMFAAGFLEGALTAPNIWYMYNNVLSTYKWAATGPPSCLTDFLDAQEAYVRAMVATSNDNRIFWDQLGLLMNQYDGLRAGYNATGNNTLTEFAFQMLNGVGDFFDIIPAVCKEYRPNFENMTKPEIDEYIRTHGHCSALVKLTGDYSQLFMAHSSWYIYQAMDRIFKHCL